MRETAKHAPPPIKPMIAGIVNCPEIDDPELSPDTKSKV
jgi:hypothetical protein